MSLNEESVAPVAASRATIDGGKSSMSRAATTPCPSTKPIGSVTHETRCSHTADPCSSAPSRSSEPPTSLAAAADGKAEHEKETAKLHPTSLAHAQSSSTS